jgi:serine/threonine-protein kinase
MLTGQPPFPGDDAVSIISQHLHADPVPPSGTTPRFPRRSTGRAAPLAKRPEDRPADATDARKLLVEALEETPDEAREARPANPWRASRAGSTWAASSSSTGFVRRSTPPSPAGARCSWSVGEPGIGKTRAAESSPRSPASAAPASTGGAAARTRARPPTGPGCRRSLLREGRRPGCSRLAARRRGGRGRAADPRGRREARHRAGQGVRQRGGPLPALRLGDEPAARRRARSPHRHRAR